MVTHSQSSITTQRVIEGYQSCVLSVAKARYFISILVPHMLTAMLLGPEFTYIFATLTVWEVGFWHGFLDNAKQTRKCLWMKASRCEAKSSSG
jgi:hypothetical protein